MKEPPPVKPGIRRNKDPMGDLVNNRKLDDFHEILGPELAKSDFFYPIWPNPNF